MLTQIPSLTSLTKNVFRILGCNPGFFTLQGTNTYILGNKSKRILIDTGEKDNLEYLNLLKNYLDENKCTIGSIVVTHWHPDHIGGVPNLVKNLNLQDVKIFKFKNEKDIPGYNYEYVENKINFIENFGVSLKLIHTPGHTKDHLVVHFEDENIVFSGDCILGEGSTVFEDLSDYLKSLETILELKPLKIFPGHGPVIDDPVSKINLQINHRLEREKKILDCLPTTDPLSVDNIVKILYKDVPEQLYKGCVFNVTNHLEKLVKEEKVKEILKDEVKVFIKID